MTTPAQLDARRQMRSWLSRGNVAEKEPLLRYAAELMAQGLSRPDRHERLASRFPGSTYQTRQAAFKHAVAFRQTERDPAARTSRSPSDISRLQTVTVGTEEMSPDIQGFAKYRAIIEFTEPTTGEPARFMVILQARANATQRELESNVNAMLTSFLNTASSREANDRYNALRSNNATFNVYRES